MLRRLARFAALFALGIFVAAFFPADAGAAENPPARYDRVEVAPAKTSIYIGRVTMTMPTFVRHGTAYEAAYTAKVFPYFFYNETGRLTIEVSDESLRALDRGEAIEFKGCGVSTDGAERPVEGKATPTSLTEGKITVRVFVSKRIELIFNTTSRLPSAVATPVSPAPKIAPD